MYLLSFPRFWPFFNLLIYFEWRDTENQQYVQWVISFSCSVIHAFHGGIGDGRFWRFESGVVKFIFLSYDPRYQENETFIFNLAFLNSRYCTS